MIKRLAHLCFKTDRMEEMVRFYRDTMGFPVKFTLDGPDGAPFGWYFEIGETSFLEVFDQASSIRQWGGQPEALHQPSGAFYQHFCLEVQDMEAERERLVAAGVPVTEIKTGLSASRQCWIADPDGNRIELMEYTPESLQLR